MSPEARGSWKWAGRANKHRGDARAQHLHSCILTKVNKNTHTCDYTLTLGDVGVHVGDTVTLALFEVLIKGMKELQDVQASSAQRKSTVLTPKICLKREI